MNAVSQPAKFLELVDGNRTKLNSKEDFHEANPYSVRAYCLFFAHSIGFALDYTGSKGHTTETFRDVNKHGEIGQGANGVNDFGDALRHFTP